MSEISVKFDSMKIAIKEITQAFESIAPLALQESYDNSGLIVGEPNKQVGKALLSLDCTPEVIEEAIRLSCDMVISHHPIVFKGLKRFNAKNYVERSVMMAIKHDIALYACHTNLDNVYNYGVNQRIANRLGLVNTYIMAPKNDLLVKLGVHVPKDHLEAVESAMFEHGAGEIGNYDECGFSWEGEGTFKPKHGSNPFSGEIGEKSAEKEYRLEMVVPNYKVGNALRALKEAHPYEEVAYDLTVLKNEWQTVGSGMIGEFVEPMQVSEFPAFLKDKMELTGFKSTKTQKQTIKKVGICGGAGSFLIGQARAMGCDAYITSDIKYHEFFDAENDMLLCDIGHYESEKYTIPLLKEILSKKIPNFATIFAQTDTNPVQNH